MVREEALVLGCEEGPFDEEGDLFIGDRNAALLADLGHERAISRVDAKRDLQLDFAHGCAGGQVRGQIHVTCRQGIGAKKCDQKHTSRRNYQYPKVILFHRSRLYRLALAAVAMHSTRRFEGKLTERWGRKASGLRDSCAYDSGVASANLKLSSSRGLRVEARFTALHTLVQRTLVREPRLHVSNDTWTKRCINRLRPPRRSPGMTHPPIAVDPTGIAINP